MIKLEDKYLKNFISKEEYDENYQNALDAYNLLMSKKGLGNDFLGWLDLPLNYDKEEFERIKLCAKRIKENAEVLLVVGIGGSYLGAKAGIELLGNYFKNDKPEIIFVGNQISSSYMHELMNYIENKNVYVNVISKSGTTTEPAIAFRIIKDFIEKKYGIEESKKRIIATTDIKKGALKTLSTKMGYETFIVPDNVGGRYSVLTPVGLLVLASKGIDIDKILDGAKLAYQESNIDSPCFNYALYRNILYKKGYKVEMLINYEPKLLYFQEWWKQLFGESEGKNHLGLFPASASFSTDLHSLGQYIQDGERIMFETVLNIVNPKNDFNIPFDSKNLDGLNFLANKGMDYVNKMALKGTTLAHVEGLVPNIILDIDKIDEFSFGYLVYFFEKACGISAYMLGINPFNQPGVEAYKKNMFALLGKPGYEDILENLNKLDK